MWYLKSLKFIAVGSTVILIGIASALTPIFANLGVGLLNLYSALTLATVQDDATSIVVLGGGLTKNSAGTISLKPLYPKPCKCRHSSAQAVSFEHYYQWCRIPMATRLFD